MASILRLCQSTALFRSDLRWECLFSLLRSASPRPFRPQPRRLVRAKRDVLGADCIANPKQTELHRLVSGWTLLIDDPWLLDLDCLARDAAAISRISMSSASL